VIKKILLLAIGAVMLFGCRPVFGPPPPTPFRLSQGPTVILPTPLPTNLPTATGTLVMNDPWTPTPVLTATPLPAEAVGLITNILDAETVLVVLQGDSFSQPSVVRLLGVDPLPNNPADPWGVVAFEQVDKWLAGKVVRLVQDTTVIDDQGALPRYLYLGNDMINLRLIELGLARPSFQNPDTEFESEFQQAAGDAEANNRGLWGPPPTPTPTRTPTVEGDEPPPQPTLTPTPTLTITLTPVNSTATPTLENINPTGTITATGTITSANP
jgi:endonuclease YncB( thermonuclease family)